MKRFTALAMSIIWLLLAAGCSYANQNVSQDTCPSHCQSVFTCFEKTLSEQKQQVLAQNRQKSILPEGYPDEVLPLMEGFLIETQIVKLRESGQNEFEITYYIHKTLDEVLSYYEPVLKKASNLQKSQIDRSTLYRFEKDGWQVDMLGIEQAPNESVKVMIVIKKL